MKTTIKTTDDRLWTPTEEELWDLQRSRFFSVLRVSEPIYLKAEAAGNCVRHSTSERAPECTEPSLLALVNSTVISNTQTIHPHSTRPKTAQTEAEASELGTRVEPPREPPHYAATQLHGPHPFSSKASGE